MRVVDDQPSPLGGQARRPERDARALDSSEIVVARSTFAGGLLVAFADRWRYPRPMELQKEAAMSNQLIGGGGGGGG